MADEAKKEYLDESGVHKIYEDMEAELSKINDMTTGINLLRGTRDFYKGTQESGFPNNPKYDGVTYASNRWEIIPAETPNEFAIAKRIAGTAASHLYFNPLLPEDVNGHSVTISAEVMFDDVPTSNIGIFQLYANSRETSTGSSIASPSTATFGLNYSEIVPNTWYKLIYKRKTPINLAEDEYLRVGLLGNADEAVSKHYRKVKLELGEINDPIWSASPFDTAQVQDALTLDDDLVNLGIVSLDNRINVNDDLNDYIVPGTYNATSVAAATLKNAPANLDTAFKLYVEHPTGREADGTFVRQRLVLYNESTIEYIRWRGSSGTWSNWRQAYELIGINGVKIPNGSDLDKYLNPGTYYVENSGSAKTIENTPKTASGYKLVVSVGYTSNARKQVATYEDANGLHQMVRTYNGSRWSPWVDTYKQTIVPIGAGGTGGTTSLEAQYNLLNDMYGSSLDASDDDYFIMKRKTDNANNGYVMRRPATSVWNWIASKIRSVFGFTEDNMLPMDRIVCRLTEDDPSKLSRTTAGTSEVTITGFDASKRYHYIEATHYEYNIGDVSFHVVFEIINANKIVLGKPDVYIINILYVWKNKGGYIRGLEKSGQDQDMVTWNNVGLTIYPSNTINNSDFEIREYYTA